MRRSGTYHFIASRDLFTYWEETNLIIPTGLLSFTSHSESAQLLIKFPFREPRFSNSKVPVTFRVRKAFVSLSC